MSQNRLFGELRIIELSYLPAMIWVDFLENRFWTERLRIMLRLFDNRQILTRVRRENDRNDMSKKSIVSVGFSYRWNPVSFRGHCT